MDDYFAAKAELFTPALRRRGGGQHRRRARPRAGRRGADPDHDVLGGGPPRGRLAGRRRAVRRGRQHVPGDRPRRRGGRRVRWPCPAGSTWPTRWAPSSAWSRPGSGWPPPWPGVAACPGVPGRLERVEAGQDFTVLVDYSHKPGAVEAVLTGLRQVTLGSLTIVLGCGGDRDRGKRPLMGAAAARLADTAIFTSDNPRSEDPLAILAQMLAGAVEVPPGAAAAEVIVPARPGRAIEAGHRHGRQGRRGADRGQGTRDRPVRRRRGDPVRRPRGRRAGPRAGAAAARRRRCARRVTADARRCTAACPGPARPTAADPEDAVIPLSVAQLAEITGAALDRGARPRRPRDRARW